ncbi:MAG: phosphoadenosine phosphosulfate reductase, partial [Okeania sp. SIO2H7]|nr:phosphoadenosine phosphosulfate reductase [Okeania sp. SIO2H7]
WGEQASELNARTGCVGCPLATKDTALENLIKLPQWNYLQPLTKLRPLYERFRGFDLRLQKTKPEILKNGKLGKNPGRKGPLTLNARLWGLKEVLKIQDEVNTIAEKESRDRVDILTLEEENRIRELITNNTWPQGWTGTEPLGNELYGQYYSNGSYQPTIFETGK